MYEYAYILCRKSEIFLHVLTLVRFQQEYYGCVVNESNRSAQRSRKPESFKESIEKLGLFREQKLVGR